MNKYFSIPLLIILLFTFTSCQKSDNAVKPPTTEENQSATQDYIGLSVDDAQALAKKNKTMFRVVKKDGEELGLSMDFVTGRINAVVEKGEVISYTIEGYDQHSWKTIISDSCQSFFDGCNNCKRITGKSDAACTRKMCKNGYEKPKCLDQ